MVTRRPAGAGTPYDAFVVRMRLGGGAGISSARVRGRLVGQPLGNSGVQLAVTQNYDFDKNAAYEYGAQAFEVRFSVEPHLSSNVTVLLIGGGGRDRAGRGGFAAPGGAGPDPGRVRCRPRDLGGPAHVRLRPGDDLQRARGIPLRRARVRGDPVRGPSPLRGGRGARQPPASSGSAWTCSCQFVDRWASASPGEYFFRRTFFKDEAETRKSFRHPQLRVFLTWRLS